MAATATTTTDLHHARTIPGHRLRWPHRHPGVLPTPPDDADHCHPPSVRHSSHHRHAPVRTGSRHRAWASAHRHGHRPESRRQPEARARPWSCPHPAPTPANRHAWPGVQHPGPVHRSGPSGSTDRPALRRHRPTGAWPGRWPGPRSGPPVASRQGTRMPPIPSVTPHHRSMAPPRKHHRHRRSGRSGLPPGAPTDRPA